MTGSHAAASQVEALRDHWLTLLRDAPEEAECFYFEVLLDALLPVIASRAGSVPVFDGLISLLGFAPEPAVLCTRLLRPERLVVLHTPETADRLTVVNRFSRLPPSSISAVPFQHDEAHIDDIYRALDEALRPFRPDGRVAIDLTGGKKTMSNQIAIAVGLLRAHTPLRVSLCYVDYDIYLPAFRKPEPLSTRLLLIDDPMAAPARALGLPGTVGSSEPPRAR